MIKFKTLILLLLVSFASYAQKGIIRGSIIEDSNGEPMFGVTVVIKGTTNGAVTDFDGKFEIKADPGVYTIQASFISFSALTVEGVEVKSGETTVLGLIRMQEDVQTLEEVIVSAEVLKNSEEAILTIKRKSANVMDGISSANFRKIGDSDAASAMKRVTGVSIEGGKYVYVRGLGDRYTKTVLNDVDIPGLDPDRNSLQMDIFPTNVIDNIIVSKSFTAELPADFTGGIVNIETKEFPETKTTKISTGIGFNPNMHFNSEYLTYEGGSTDFLGFDDGTRAIPTDRSTTIPQYVDALGNSGKAAEYEGILRGFNKTMAAMNKTSFMDYSLGFSTGNQFAKKFGTLGYNVALTYRNETDFYKDAVYGRYGLQDSSVREMEVREYQSGNFGVNNVLLGGLAGIALKRDHSKYKVNVLHLQNGESKAGEFKYIGSDQGSNFEADQTNLEYSERALTNVLINGQHFSDDGRWGVDWKISPTNSSMNDPDIRYTRYRTDGDQLSIGTESGLPARIWRYLDEQNLVARFDVTRELLILGNDAKIRFGANNTYKQRAYEIQDFQIRPNGIELTGDPNELFSDDNLWSRANNANGLFVDPGFIPNNPNKYDANINVTGGYSSVEFSPIASLKAIAGLRVEKYTQRYTGSNQLGTRVLDNDKVLDDLDLFPTVNLIYSASKMQNIRASYSRTIARPSFKEVSFAEIFDPVSGRTFIGGMFVDTEANGDTIWSGNLTATRINNYDLRWELFQKRASTISIGGFYKTFDAPIEIVQYAKATNNFQPRNVGDGMVYGAEIELRQSLSPLTDILANYFINLNFTYAISEIEMSDTEFNSRVNNARVGQTIKNTRQMAGQAPYIFNGGFSYSGADNGLEAGLFYNVQGPTLLFVGIADRPDIYSVPFHSLNFNANKNFGPDDRISAGVKISNILGDKREEVFQSFEAANQYFTRLNPGRDFSVRLGYSF